MRPLARLTILGPVLAASVVVAPVAGADTTDLAQSGSVGVQTVPWTAGVAFERFDPARGELIEVSIELTGQLRASFDHENTSDAPVSVSAAATAHVALGMVGAAWSTVAQPSVSRTTTLEAYDGVADFGGPSGHHATIDLQSAAPSVVLTSPTDLAPFIGSGTLVLAASATATTSGAAAGVLTDVGVRAGAVVQVTYRYLSDERAPDAPNITSAPAAVTNDLTPTLTFTAEPNAATACRLDRPGGPGTWAACTSPWTVSLPSASSGTHTMAVRATDPAGNTSEPSSVAFVVDVDPPAQPVITAHPSSPSHLEDPSWSFSTVAGTTTTCRIDDHSPVPCTHTFTPDLRQLAEGPHVFAVFAADAAGNTSTAASSTYLLDRTAPGAPTIVTAPGSPSSDPTPRWSFTAETGTSLACSVDAGPFVACGVSHTVDLTAALDGPHTLAVRATDTAGNVGEPVEATFVLDRVGPPAPTLTGPSVGNDPTPTFTFTGEDGARFECQVDLGTPTDCSGSFEPSLTADAVYVISVWAIDDAGNRGDAATTSYRFDTTPPPAPTITGLPPEASPNDRPGWTFVVGPMRTAECAVDGGAWVTCVDSFTADLTGAGDGLHAFAVRAIDLAGNVGAPAEDSFLLDRSAPPAPTITGSPSTPGRDTNPTWTFDAAGDATTECSTDGTIWEACDGTVTVELPAGAADLVVELRVRSRDGAGNTSLPEVRSYTLDRTAPERPIITSAPASPSNRTSATWAFTVEAESDAECALDGGAWEPCPSGLAVLFGAGADGPHSVSIRTTDRAGNTSEIATGEYVLDTAPPPAPTITGGPDPASTDATPTWTFTTELGATTDCRVDDGAWAPCGGSVGADFAAAEDGTHGIEVRATDAVGNLGDVTASAYLLDRSVPEAPVFTTLPATSGNSRVPRWTFNSEEGAVTECSFADGPWEPCEHEAEADLDGGDDGTYELAVRTTDAAGNQSLLLVGTYELDTTAPDQPEVVGPRGPTNDPTPEWRITVEPGSAAECAIDEGAFEPCGGLLTVTLVDGPHHVYLRAVDSAGNTSEVATVSAIVDTVAPPPPSFTHARSAADPTWGVAAAPGSTAECSLDGGPWGPCSGAVGGPAASRLDVRAVDDAGNRSEVVSAPVMVATSIGEPTGVPNGPAGPGGLRADPSVGPGFSIFAAPVGVLVPPVAAAVVVPALAADSAPTLPSAAADPPETVLGNLVPVLPPEVALLIQNAVERSTLPVVLIGVVIAFVAIQDRLDRRDPKLAMAPLRDEPEYLEFK